MIFAERLFRVAFWICGRALRLTDPCLCVHISLLFTYVVNIAILCPKEVNLRTLTSEADTDFYSAVNWSLFTLIKLGNGASQKEEREWKIIGRKKLHL